MLEKAAAKVSSAQVTDGLPPDGLPWQQRRWAVLSIFTALAMGRSTP
jgi:hypothetical protein